MAVHQLGAHLVPRFHQDNPGNGVQFKGADELGIRVYIRARPEMLETWLIRPDASVMLYTHHAGGRLIAAYRHKAKRAKA